MQVLGHYKVVLDGTWWYWLSRGRYWLIFGGIVSKWGCTGWYLVVLGHYNLVLLGIKWYWASKGLLCLYILKKKKNEDLVRCHHSRTNDKRRTRKDRASEPQWIMED